MNAVLLRAACGGPVGRSRRTHRQKRGEEHRPELQRNDRKHADTKEAEERKKTEEKEDCCLFATFQQAAQGVDGQRHLLLLRFRDVQSNSALHSSLDRVARHKGSRGRVVRQGDKRSNNLAQPLDDAGIVELGHKIVDHVHRHLVQVRTEDGR